MNNQKSIAKIEKCINEKKLCAIGREYVDTLCLYGYPTNMSKELCAMHFVYDFTIDGYKIIRKSDITEVYSGEEEAFLSSVTEKENAGFAVKAPELNIESMESLFEDLMEKGTLVTVECEDFEENILLIGKVVGTDGDVVELKTFDGMGRWDKEISSVDIDDVSCVSIGNSYMNIIEKYLK